MNGVTVPDFVAAKKAGRKLAMLTAYDYTTARLVDAAGADGILVGDSLGMVIQGEPNALSVTLDDMVYHTRCVARAANRALIVADLPFMTFQVNAEEALRNAGRLMQQGKAHAVKLEGGVRSVAAIKAITRADIPVMGHVGLTPQSVHKFGGFRVQRDERSLLEDARAVEEAGAFAVVLECVPAALAAQVTAELSIPTIGIGAGSGCDGQVLVLQDMLGMYDEIRPKFVKHFAELGEQIRAAVGEYCREVRTGSFPDADHEFK